MASSISSSGGVPPGFRFHPTDEELLLYYLKKKVSFEKFDLDVIRDVDLNKMEPWDLQERCRIGAAPQNEWYLFSHKDRKYPTGSRTNRATGAGFWKATGRDKCIRTTYKKIGMRKTLVFYRGRAPHGQKTDWIMHEYRLEDSDDPQVAGTEDEWVICRVFKKKCFFTPRSGGSSSSASHGAEHNQNNNAIVGEQLRPLSLLETQHYLHQHHTFAGHQQSHGSATATFYDLSHYPQPPPLSYAGSGHVQVHDLLSAHRPSGYEFLSSGEPSGDINVGGGACEPLQHVGGGREQHGSDRWAVLDSMEGRYGSDTTGAAVVQQINQISGGQRGGEMDLWGYGK